MVSKDLNPIYVVILDVYSYQNVTIMDVLRYSFNHQSLIRVMFSLRQASRYLSGNQLSSSSISQRDLLAAF